MKKYGLIGETLKHSFSPMLHHEFGNKEYDLIEIPKTEIQDYMKDACFEAINVTIPYKETVIPFCELDETAKTIGAVNTIVNKVIHLINTCIKLIIIIIIIEFDYI